MLCSLSNYCNNPPTHTGACSQPVKDSYQYGPLLELIRLVRATGGPHQYLWVGSQSQSLKRTYTDTYIYLGATKVGCALVPRGHLERSNLPGRAFRPHLQFIQRGPFELLFFVRCPFSFISPRCIKLRFILFGNVPEYNLLCTHTFVTISAFPPKATREPYIPYFERVG